MPDAKFAKPWHGIAREEIEWHSSVDEGACIGCRTCVTGYSRKVYRFDFARKKAVVADPLDCMVACMTCANTCPTKRHQLPSGAHDPGSRRPGRGPPFGRGRTAGTARRTRCHRRPAARGSHRRDGRARHRTDRFRHPAPDSVPAAGAGPDVPVRPWPVHRAMGTRRQLDEPGVLDRQCPPARRVDRGADPKGRRRETVGLGVRAGGRRRRGRLPGGRSGRSPYAHPRDGR